MDLWFHYEHRCTFPDRTRMRVTLLTPVVLMLTRCTWANTPSRPHIILILADDLGWNDVGYHGSTQIPTPNLDALAYDGIILNNYYVQPICTPTRSALMTGRHPIHTGLQHSVITGAQPYGLGLNETIMPQYLNKLGYSSHIVGKWHLGFFAKEYTPIYRGFKSHFGYYHGMEDYFDHTNCNSDCNTTREWGLDFWKNMDVVDDAFMKYSTELFTSEAEDIIYNHNKSKPLFLYLPHQAVHSANAWRPLEAPWKYMKNFMHIEHEGRRTYAAMLSALDDSVGNITRALHETGMLDDAIIIFSTDNGGPAAGFDMNYASNWPLRGVKATLWEGGVKGTGFIWSTKLKSRSGSVSADMIHVTDWLPTIVHAAGVDPHDLPSNLDGLDMWPTLLESVPSPRTEILHNIDPIQHTFALRSGDWKILSGLSYKNWNGWYPPEKGATKRNINTSKGLSEVQHILQKMGRDKLSSAKPVVVDCGQRPPNASTNCKPLEQPCLFHIADDPCEFNNVAAEHPGIVQQLLGRVQTHNQTAVPFRGKPDDPKGFPIYHNGIWEPWVELDTIKDSDH